MLEQKNLRLSVAPMIDWTDRHCRYFLRLISHHITLYTEMITTGAILQGKDQTILTFNASESPVVLQLGGSDPKALAECARRGEALGYAAINLNVGCPSDRVQRGLFGACLMAKPELVAEGIVAMRKAVQIPVTIKTRLGIDDCDDEAFIDRFITLTAAAGCDTFIIHARKAWLKGLSPHENRTIPPLRYDQALRLVKKFPTCNFVLNGGITTFNDCRAHLAQFAGVMVGRAVMHAPWWLHGVDEVFYDAPARALSRWQVLAEFVPYLESQFVQGVPLSILCRPLMNMFHGLSGARNWRRALTEAMAQRALSAVVKLLTHNNFLM